MKTQISISLNTHSCNIFMSTYSMNLWFDIGVHSNVLSDILSFITCQNVRNMCYYGTRCQGVGITDSFISEYHRPSHCDQAKKSQNYD